MLDQQLAVAAGTRLEVHALAWPRLEQTAFHDAPFMLTTLHTVSAATRSFVLVGDGAHGLTFLASHVRPRHLHCSGF